MGKKDTITKNYMKENRVFADTFNYLLYNGQQMIQPEKLREIDTTEMAILQGGDQKHQDSETVQKYRDILKKTVVKEDGETVYLLLGVENQTDIHYAMPVRNLIYDALQYGKQVSDITAENRKTGKKRAAGTVSDESSRFCSIIIAFITCAAAFSIYIRVFSVIYSFNLSLSFAYFMHPSTSRRLV